MVAGAGENADGAAGAMSAHGAIICTEPEHLLHPTAVNLATRILKPWLEHQKLTTLELLTNKEAMADLRNSVAVYNAAISTGAQRQAEMAGGEPGERAKELRSYLDRFFQFASDEQVELMPIGPSGLEAHYRARERSVGKVTARRHLIMSVMRYLENSPSWGTKAERLVVVLEKHEDEAIQRVADEMLAGLFALDQAIADIFVEESNPFALLHDFMGLISAQPQPRRGSTKLIQRMTTLMSKYDLRYTRNAIQNAFERIITNTKHFTPPRALDAIPLAMWELTEFSKLNKKMVAAGGWFATKDLLTAMDTQVARRTGQLQLDEYTAEHHGVFAKTVELLKIYPLVFGERNLARIETRIMDYMMQRDLSRLLESGARSPMDQLALYGILEQKIRKANMPLGMTNEMITHLSRLQEAFIRERQVFQKFRYLRTGTGEKGIYVLEMLILGAFTNGRCRKAAIRLMLHFLESKQQLMEALNDATGVETDDDRTEELCAMYDYFIESM